MQNIPRNPENPQMPSQQVFHPYDPQNPEFVQRQQVMMMNNYMHQQPPQGYPENMANYPQPQANPGFSQYGVYNEQQNYGQQQIPPPGYLPEPQQLQMETGFGQYYHENQNLYSQQNQAPSQRDVDYENFYAQRNLELMQHRSFGDQNSHEASKFKELIDTDMEKELELFRKDFAGLRLEENPRTAQVFSVTGNKLGSNPQGQNSKNPGVFAEAVFGLSSFIQQSTDPLDNMLNPFCQRKDSEELPKGEENINRKKDISKFLPKNNRDRGENQEGKKLSKKLGKFVKDKESKSQDKKGGFSLSQFWKKK